MVVDDSAVVRGLIVRMLEADGGIEVVASVGNGQIAVSTLTRMDIDVIILDIEMPVMDGLTALPKLLQVDPDVRIIMASTLTLRNAEVSIRALQAGASDYIPKPSSSRELSGGMDFRRELIEKVHTLGRTRRVGRSRGPARPAPTRVRFAPPLPPQPAKVTLREPGRFRPEVLAIGSSTGGPQALFTLLKSIPKDIRLPIFLTQHMPATFTTILAEHITRMTGWACAEGRDGDTVTPGRILLAPGDYHMTIEARGPHRLVRLNQDPPQNFCRPSVDVMLRSIERVYGARTLAAILTGMGQDGLAACRQVVDAGGTVVAQDEASSIVWGMPGAVANAGLCSAVLPLPELAAYIARTALRGAQ
jgi:two-component system chemotaxis response regulator CheB